MYYELYIDVLFLVNFMMDYILLLIARKILKCSATHGNICVGALAGALMTCVITVIPMSQPVVKFVLFHAVVNVVMVKLGLKIRWGKSLIKALLVLYISGFLVGGIFESLHQYIKVGSLFFALAIVSYYIASAALSMIELLFRIGEHRCKVTLYCGEKECTVEALVDTGNSLRDTLSGEPVSIVDKDVLDLLIKDYSERGVRYISYHSIGKKDGVIPIIKLDKLLISGKQKKWIESPIVAVSESEITASGEYEMILNPDIL